MTTSIRFLTYTKPASPFAKGRKRNGAPLLRYQGQLLSSFDLHHRQRLVCPACLAEKVVHRARWDLLGFGDCSRHGTQLLWRCPACEEAIGWDRCGMSA
ncbi:hypothetical protein [Roseomonas xinghualingensis]|uniref:hypothetical protein n=1 Tax=Roseomonas xinghualingensis TaxID=2986475 RepID=UPI0036729FB2